MMLSLKQVKHSAKFISTLRYGEQRKVEQLRLFALVVKAIATGEHNTTGKNLAKAAFEAVNFEEFKNYV